MVKIMVVGKYPPHKVNELIKVYTSPNKPAYPDFLKKVENWAAQITGEKYKSYAVYESPDDKIIESLAAISKRYNLYASIEGYTFAIELLVEAEDAIKMMLGK